MDDYGDYVYDQDLNQAAVRAVLAGEDDEFDPSMREDVKELVVADYLVFLLALDTYMRYLDERFGSTDLNDSILQKGIRLLRAAEGQNLDKIISYIEANVPKASAKMVQRSRSFPANVQGISRRAFLLRTALSRGGASTMKAVFDDSARARKEAKEAIDASLMDDEDAALTRFAAITLRNKRLEKWIDTASEAAQPESAILSDVQVVTKSVEEDATKMLRQRIEQEAETTSETFTEGSSDIQSEGLERIELEATEEAQRLLSRADKEDGPLNRSEVVGVAKAVAMAVATDPDIPANVPESLRSLDSEQRAAALTDGRVLVAAGAGSGKSTTLVARVKYLVQERRESPSKIFVTSFNAEAASELQHKIGKAVGDDAYKQMSIGTMHSLFRGFISEYGNPEEKMAVGASRSGPNGFIGTGSKVAYSIQKAWAQCFGEDEKAPKLKEAMLYKSKWAGNNITPAQAKAGAKSADEEKYATWYEWYEGFKGAIPGWRPPCPTKEWEIFKSKNRPSTSGRPDGIRLGDFDDMLSIFRDILLRDPAVRKKIQSLYSHILVDECQDLNRTQFSIVQMISEHIEDDSGGKSIWMVGDADQSIYAFRGAEPGQFTALYDDDAWKNRLIRTNYRCPPEIVEAANRMIEINEDRIDKVAVVDPRKNRGSASILVTTPGDEAEAAIEVIHRIKSELEVGAEVSDFAILTKTNKEQHAYETACIIRGIPYARKGNSSFFGSPETKAFLSYVQLATGDDNIKMQAALKESLTKPNRFFKSPDIIARAVDQTLADWSFRTNQEVKAINPVTAIQDHRFQELLAQKITGGASGFRLKKTAETVGFFGWAIADMRRNTEDPEYKTKDLFGDILNMTGVASRVDPQTGKMEYYDQTFRESLTADLNNKMDDEPPEEDEEDEESEGAGLGNISFLFELAKVDPTDPEDVGWDPGTPRGFSAKMKRYASKMRDLRIDLNKWKEQQKALPADQRRPPPGVYVGTAHSTKGAQWKNCFVQMPAGKFPFEKKPKPGAPPPDPVEEQRELESERRLAYVALTRASQNLQVVCPNRIGGKPAGISQFVSEAGLAVGENVRPVAEEPGDKTASELPLHVRLGLEGFDSSDEPDVTPRNDLDWKE